MTQSTRRSNASGEAAVLARRYADAFYDLAEDEKLLDTVATDLRMLLQTANGNSDFIAIANHPRLTRTQLVQVAQTLAATLKLNALTGKFIALIAKQRRLSILGYVIDAFLNRLAKERGEFTAFVSTATALSQQQTEKLSSRLAAMAGGKIHLNISEDKSLIGGVTVQLGSRLIDASIKSKLLRLERALKTAAA